MDEAAALTEQIADVLYEHMARTEKTGYIHGCKCGWSARPDKSYRAHVAAEIAARLADSRPAVTEAAITEAEQRGREDNADHGMCYVSGSKALAAKLADAWDEGHEDGCIQAHCFTQRGMSYFEESKLTDCHTRNPYRLSPTGDDSP